MWNILTELKNTQTESQVIKNKVVINFKKSKGLDCISLFDLAENNVLIIKIMRC